MNSEICEKSLHSRHSQASSDAEETGHAADTQQVKAKRVAEKLTEQQMASDVADKLAKIKSKQLVSTLADIEQTCKCQQLFEVLAVCAQSSADVNAVKHLVQTISGVSQSFVEFVELDEQTKMKKDLEKHARDVKLISQRLCQVLNNAIDIVFGIPVTYQTFCKNIYSLAHILAKHSYRTQRQIKPKTPKDEEHKSQSTKPPKEKKKPAEKASGKASEKAPEKTQEKPAEKLAEKPAETPEPKSATKTAERPAEKPAKKSTEDKPKKPKKSKEPTSPPKKESKQIVQSHTNSKQSTEHAKKVETQTIGGQYFDTDSFFGTDKK